MGYCLSYIPSHVMSGFYFEKHRSLATGVVTSGSGLGAVLFPILIQYLIEEYTWQGSFFILACLNLQTCVFAALLKPLSEKNPKGTEIHDKTEQMLLDDNYAENENETASLNKNKELSHLEEDNLKKPKKIWKERHCSIFVNFNFVVYFISNLLWNMGASIIMVFGAEYFTLNGQSKVEASELVMLFGLGTFFGGLVGGGLGNISHLPVNRICIYNMGTFVTGACSLIFPAEVVHSYTGFAIVSFSYGFWFGVILGMLVVVLADILSIHALGDGMGYLMFANGAGCLAGPPLAGKYCLNFFNLCLQTFQF